MSVTTSSIQVHVLPNKATIHLHEADRELVGVHGVEVDVMDYPSQQATAALNAFNANVTLNRAEHFTLMVFDPKKQSWLTPLRAIRHSQATAITVACWMSLSYPSGAFSKPRRT